MDQETLVGLEIKSGADIVKILDEAGFRVNVALWATFPEYGDPRLVLASRRFDQSDLLAAYESVLGALRKHGVSPHQRPSLLILKMKDPFIQGLRKIFAQTKSVLGMRLGGQSWGGRFIEDAYVYRIT